MNIITSCIFIENRILSNAARFSLIALEHSEFHHGVEGLLPGLVFDIAALAADLIALETFTISFSGSSSHIRGIVVSQIEAKEVQSAVRRHQLGVKDDHSCSLPRHSIKSGAR